RDGSLKLTTMLWVSRQAREAPVRDKRRRWAALVRSRANQVAKLEQSDPARGDVVQVALRIANRVPNFVESFGLVDHLQNEVRAIGLPGHSELQVLTKRPIEADAVVYHGSIREPC